MSEQIQLATDCNVHPECFCQIVGGNWVFNSLGDPKTNSESPCPHCVEAKSIWERTGEIRNINQLSCVCPKVDPLYNYLKNK